MRFRLEAGNFAVWTWTVSDMDRQTAGLSPVPTLPRSPTGYYRDSFSATRRDPENTDVFPLSTTSNLRV